MAMGRRERQKDLWIAASDLPTSGGHPFYRRLSELLDKHEFDAFVEGECEEFYAPRLGRPSLTPGIYFRTLLIGYFEGIDSERGVAWRIGDSPSLRRFLVIELDEQAPDHSAISRTRRLIDIETHRAVFSWVPRLLAREGLLAGGTIGVDATTTMEETLIEAAQQLEAAAEEVGEAVEELSEVVTDKGYHSNAVLTALTELELRSYVSEPRRGRCKWGGRRRQRDAVYGNRRRMKGERGKRLMRQRAERVERSFAHCYETGGMRRVHLKGRENVLKRLLIHVGGFNLSVAMRKTVGAGTPRGLADVRKRAKAALEGLPLASWAALRRLCEALRAASGEGPRCSRRASA